MNPEQLEFFGRVNFLKAGIAWSNAVSTVSKGYAREIQTPEYGFGLDGFLRRHGPITGIVNGVDYSEWSPEHDPHIAQNYSASRPFRKARLQAGHPGRIRPAAATIWTGRCSPSFRASPSQKGFDILADAASRLMAEDVNLVVLGSGDPAHESMFRALAERLSAIGWACRWATTPAYRIESKPEPICSSCPAVMSPAA